MLSPLCRITVGGNDAGELSVGTEGFLGAATENHYWIKAHLSSTERGFIVHQKQQGKEVVMRAEPFREKVDGNVRIHMSAVHVNTQTGGTTPGGNDVRIAVISPGFEIEYYQLALVVQDDKLWVVNQQKGRGAFYRSPDGLVGCTGIRAELSAELAHLVEEKVLPRLSEVPEVEIPNPPREEKTAVVEWYDDARQVGMLNVWQGEDNAYLSAKIHWTQCPARGVTGRRFLKQGELVKFDKLAEKSDRRSKIALEAQGVTLLQPETEVSAVAVV